MPTLTRLPCNGEKLQQQFWRSQHLVHRVRTRVPRVCRLVTRNYLVSCLRYIFLGILELCQQTSQNGTTPCDYWTYFPSISKCFMLESCNPHDNPEAFSGERNCPPGRYFLWILLQLSIFNFSVLSCPEKDVSCIPSCDTSNSQSIDNVISQRQCASKYA